MAPRVKDPIPASEAVLADPRDLAEAFPVFFERERARLFRALLVVIRDPHEAEDITQDAFCRVWERWESVRAMDDPVGYVYRTAFNLQRSRWRSLGRGARHVLRQDEPADPLEDVLIHDEATRALARLTPRQRAAAVLTELLGFPSKEAGEILGIRPGTVRMLVSQARSTLNATETSDE